MNAINKFSIVTLSTAIVLSGTSAALAATLSPEPQPIDLRTWKQQGNPANGKWIVSPDGSSVLQTINGDPTFFVSPEEFIDTTINGKFKVETNLDDDFIGFVFGYKSPIAAEQQIFINQDGVSDRFEFMLFDWKQNRQSSRGYLGNEGFSISQVNAENLINNPYAFIDKKHPVFNLIASDYSNDNGWQDRTEYEFTLLYQRDRVKIDIDGNTIFDISANEVGEEFQPGHFGFYNLSQPWVRYSGFTQKKSPSEAPISVPEPSLTLALLAFGTGGLATLAIANKTKVKNIQYPPYIKSKKWATLCGAWKK